MSDGCDYCTHPLYTGIKCPNCGRKQPAQQEPVGYVCFGGDEVVWTDEPPESGTLLYTSSPAQRKPLTFSKLCDIEYEITHRDGDFSILRFARAIEAAHGIKEKNT